MVLRTVIMIFILSLSSLAMGKNISVNIDGKIYQCSGNGNGGSVNCESKIEGLELLVDSCKESYGASYCMDKYWSDFVKENPQCKAEGLPICIEACKQSYGAAYCADKCNRV